jgi:putative transposase
MRKKVVSPGHRRQMAKEVVEAGVCSGRAVCRILRLSRATYRYRAKPPSPCKRQMIARMRLLSEKHPRYGYRRITALLRQEG